MILDHARTLLEPESPAKPYAIPTLSAAVHHVTDRSEHTLMFFSKEEEQNLKRQTALFYGNTHSACTQYQKKHELASDFAHELLARQHFVMLLPFCSHHALFAAANCHESDHVRSFRSICVACITCIFTSRTNSNPHQAALITRPSHSTLALCFSNLKCPPFCAR